MRCQWAQERGRRYQRSLSRLAQVLPCPQKTLHMFLTENFELTSFPLDLRNITQLRQTLSQVQKIGTLGGVTYNVSCLCESL